MVERICSTTEVAMGLFKSIGKAFKKVVKGVGKVFKKIGKGIGKILNSKWGKILMVAAAVFTGGMALVGAWQGMAGATGFFGKFAAGAKGFLTGLMKPVQTAKGLMGGAAQGGQVAGQIGTAAGQTGGELAAVTDVTGAVAQGGADVAGGVAAGTDVAGQVGQAAAGGAGGGGGAGLAADAAAGLSATAEGAAIPGYSLEAGLAKPGLLSRAGGAIQSVGETVGAGLESVAPKGGWLRNAAKAGYDFMNSPVGGYLLKGYGEGMAAEEQNKFDDRYRQAWRDPNNPFATRDRTRLPTGATRDPLTADQTIQYDRFYNQQPQGGAI